MHRPSRSRRLGGLLAAAGAAIALAAPISASAIVPTDVPDVGADTGRFTLPITCQITFPSLGNITVLNLPATVDIQGIAPVQLAPGQPFYLSQGSGALTLPSWLSTLGGLVAVNQADADVDALNIAATNSTPSVINVSKLQSLSVKGIRIRSGQPIVVGLPKTGAFNIGPYKAPQSGLTQLKFVSATANVTLRATWGLTLKIRAYCKAAASAGGGASLLSIAVGGAPKTETANFQGQPLNFPTAPINQLIGIVHAPYQCTLGGGSYKIGIAVTATIPLTVSKTGSLPFNKASGAFVIPAETVNRFLDEGKTSVGGTVTKLTLKASGGTPTEPNVIPAGGLPIPTTPLVRDQRIVIPLPQDGTIDAGPFTPDAGSKAILVGLGSAAADLTFNDGTTATTGTCDAPSPDALLVDAAVI